MSGAIKERFVKVNPVVKSVVSEEEANAALMDPDFRETLTMVTDIKESHGINLLDYDSIEEYTLAFLSSFDTDALKRVKRSLVAAGETTEALDKVLETRMSEVAVLVQKRCAESDSSVRCLTILK